MNIKPQGIQSKLYLKKGKLLACYLGDFIANKTGEPIWMQNQLISFFTMFCFGLSFLTGNFS